MIEEHLKPKQIAKGVTYDPVKKEATYCVRDLIEGRKETTLDMVRANTVDMAQDYVADLYESVKQGKKDFAGYDFFIEIVPNDQPHLSTLHNMHFISRGCPEPKFNRTLWHWNNKEEKLDYIWCLPSKHKAYNLATEKLTMTDPANRNSYMLLLAFAKGDLHKMQVDLNNRAVEQLNK